MFVFRTLVKFTSSILSLSRVSQCIMINYNQLIPKKENIDNDEKMMPFRVPDNRGSYSGKLSNYA